MHQRLHPTGVALVVVAFFSLSLLGLDFRKDEVSRMADEHDTQGKCSLHSDAVVGNSSCNGTKLMTWNAQDLWKIDGVYYDLRPLMAWHPGSPLPLEKTMGSDASVLFRVQHLSDGPRRALKKYEVARELVDGSIEDSEYHYLFEPEGFYMTLRSRVQKHLEDAGVSKPRQANLPILAKIGLNVLIFGGSWYQISFGAFSPIAIVLNLVSRLVLTGAAHEAMHGSVAPQLPRVQYVYAKFVVEGLLGFPMESWWHEHVLFHHLHTKQLIDPDENIDQGVPVWRLTNSSEWSELHAYPLASHFLVGLLHPHLRCFVVESWRLLDDDPAVRANGAFVMAMVISLHWLPLFVQKNKRKALLAIFLSSMLASMTTMFAFHVNHLFPEAEGGLHQLTDWGERQIVTTANFHSTAISGGLDMQIEHHLFPMLSYNHQQAAQATIKEVAEEFGLPYRSYNSLTAGLVKHFAYMVELGKRPA